MLARNRSALGLLCWGRAERGALLVVESRHDVRAQDLPRDSKSEQREKKVPDSSWEVACQKRMHESNTPSFGTYERDLKSFRRNSGRLRTGS